jgi:hypothetical protein
MRNPSIILAVVAMTMASSAKAQTAFSDDQIRSALVGNTISGQESGEPYVEFLRPDGRIDGAGADGRYTGHWVISRGRMCMSYDEEDGKATPWDCARVVTQGDRVIWVDQGEKSYSALSRGNPRNL